MELTRLGVRGFLLWKNVNAMSLCCILGTVLEARPCVVSRRAADEIAFHARRARLREPDLVFSYRERVVLTGAWHGDCVSGELPRSSNWRRVPWSELRQSSLSDSRNPHYDARDNRPLSVSGTRVRRRRPLPRYPLPVRLRQSARAEIAEALEATAGRRGARRAFRRPTLPGQ